MTPSSLPVPSFSRGSAIAQHFVRPLNSQDHAFQIIQPPMFNLAYNKHYLEQGEEEVGCSSPAICPQLSDSE